MEEKSIEKATFGGGCFWCLDAVFRKLKGVTEVVSGYAGGETEKPSYETVSTGKTGHAEVVQVGFNPKLISYEVLLDIFWQMHDPTTLNRQGDDIGTQYRSVIFYHNDEQKKLAENSKKELIASGKFESPIVTEIKPLGTFYPAEEYHQNYYAKNPDQPYCLFNISPKLLKVEKRFSGKLKE